MYCFLLAVSDVVSNNAIMHAEASLFSTFLCSFKYRQKAPFTVLVLFFSHKLQSVQILSECTTYPLVFIVFPAVPNRFKYRRPECTRHLPSLFSFFSLRLQIISNTVRMHHLPSLLSLFSLQFQIVSNAV